ncbi:unnamed protein product [Phytophthora lilii]|uniref:Unnamed protein product n=1 Tax=Phytophthora lilii TaxID=2077276 RepID=A0A9W6XGL1_9STRA|nr:unnamed protein product [Phytophthora lilii]
MRSEAVDTQGGAPGDRTPATNAAAADVAGNVAVVATACVANATGAESPATPMEVALAAHTADHGSSSRSCPAELEQKPRSRLEQQEQDDPMTASQVTQMQNEQRRERHWRRMVHGELRDRLVASMYVAVDGEEREEERVADGVLMVDAGWNSCNG